MVTMTGFHGTLKNKAQNILNNGFIHSTKNTEWLGFGVYFFAEQQYAEKWALSEAEKPKNKGEVPSVLSCLIRCKENEYYDLDNEDNMDKIVKCLSGVLKGLEGKNSTKLDEAQIRCAACNFFAKKYGIKVYSYTFPLRRTNSYGFPFVINQKQICVNNNECISCVKECLI